MPGNCAFPCISASRVFFGSSSKGIERSIPSLSAASFRFETMYDELEPGPSAPSRSGLDGSQITFTGSNAQVLPTPLQASHAPYGLLNENERGSSCGILVPS